MKVRIALFAAVLLAGCSHDDTPVDSARGVTNSAPSAEMAAAAAAAIGAPANAQASPDASVAVAALGTGTVTEIDAAGGTVTIEHGPIDALNWPAMTMAFDASPAMLGSLNEGDKVQFEFTQQGRTSTITEIKSGN